MRHLTGVLVSMGLLVGLACLMNPDPPEPRLTKEEFRLELDRCWEQEGMAACRCIYDVDSRGHRDEWKQEYNACYIKVGCIL